MSDHSMETLSQAITRLQDDGYGGNWIAHPGGQLRCSQCGRRFDATEVRIDHMVRFEGESDPGDESVLFALTGTCGDQGLYSAAYGPDATIEDTEVIGRLQS